jgi:hypothetical protein
VVAQRGGDSGFGGVLLFLLAAGTLVWFLQSQTSAGGLSLGAPWLCTMHETDAPRYWIAQLI